MINELDDRLSTVKRWVILRTIQTQSVAEHCFNVQRICMGLAPWFRITNPKELFALSQAALHHDDDEALTGDIPSPAKRYFESYEKGIDDGVSSWYTKAGHQARSIVKLADMLEAFHFLTIEMHLGNRYVRQHKVNIKRGITFFIESHTDWPPEVSEQCVKWMARIEVTESRTYERESIRSSTESAAS